MIASNLCSVAFVWAKRQSYWLGRSALVWVAAFTWLAAIEVRAFEVEVSEAPTTNLALTVSAIQSAQSSLLLNIYELTSPQIVDALLGRIQAGVHVEILEEGQPVGGLSTAARGVVAQLAQAMRSAGGDDHLFQMTSKTGAKRRFRFDHAKYAVIDDQRLLLGSENYSPSGNPLPGTIGNRGWEVVVHDPAISLEFKNVFRQDADLSAGDLEDLTATALNLSLTSNNRGTRNNPPLATTPGVPLAPQGQLLEATAVTRVTSPDLSLSGLLALINSATSRLDIQQMTFDPTWGKVAGQSPLLDAVIAAARRGVKVRVLLNDERVFNHSSHPSRPKNVPTVEQLNQIASSEGLHLSARIADLKAMGVDYIHNKGALADESRTLISSINWDENSVEHNREAAIILESRDINAHYSALFDRDWIASESSASAVPVMPLNPPIENLMALPGEGLEATAVRVDTVACPVSLALSAQIGDLSVSDAEDQDFMTLSGKTVSGEFVRIQGRDGCVFAEKGASRNVTGRRFVEIRAAHGGGKNILLEGFTPKSGKVYSIRTKVASGDGLDGTFDSLVYDGSGAGRELLGRATVSIKTVE